MHDLTTPPSVTAFHPQNKTSDAAVVIFPGGGYYMRAAHEGEGYAAFLNAHGMTAFVVDYRVSPHRFPCQLYDARYAVRYVRCHAAQWGLDPHRIAVMGSSAGGHLAALCATCDPAYMRDETEAYGDVSPRPDAQILCYPVIGSPTALGDRSHRGSYENLIGGRDPVLEKELDPCTLVSDATPPAFIWHTSDDGCVDVVNSYTYAQRLHRYGVPTEMHVFPHGRHGLGLAAEEEPHAAQWSSLLLNWFRYLTWL